MSCSSPSAKQAKLFCPVNGLADSVLEEIFKRLPSYERLVVSEVCRRWHSISHKSWLDISKIDLAPIPGKHIRAIVNQCPNLQSVFAVNKTFDANELTCLAKVPSLKRVSFISCEFMLNPDKFSIVQNVFSNSLENASWTELILHDAHFWAPQNAWGVYLRTEFTFSVASLPASLMHLHLRSLRVCGDFYGESSLCLDGLERLANLERFILHYADHQDSVHHSYAPELVWRTLTRSDAFLDKLGRLKNLKELCLGPALLTGLADLVSGLPKLEVLFLTHMNGNSIADDLAKLITSNSVLRILVLSGMFVVDGPIELPARKRFPHGFGSDPLPLLHIFVGKKASENICFTKSTLDAAIIHPINLPMPEFLGREDIAPIFQGVWVAEKIKEAAKYGGKLWCYEFYDSASSIQHA